jgi:non-heme chloroperoxidase
LDDLFR